MRNVTHLSLDLFLGEEPLCLPVSLPVYRTVKLVERYLRSILCAGRLEFFSVPEVTRSAPWIRSYVTSASRIPLCVMEATEPQMLGREHDAAEKPTESRCRDIVSFSRVVANDVQGLPSATVTKHTARRVVWQNTIRETVDIDREASQEKRLIDHSMGIFAHWTPCTSTYPIV